MILKKEIKYKSSFRIHFVFTLLFLSAPIIKTIKSNWLKTTGKRNQADKAKKLVKGAKNTNK